MLTRLIVASYAWLIEAGLWLAIALAAFAGYNITPSVLLRLGAVPTPEIAWQFLGALVLPVITFLILAVFAGPFLLLVDIRHSLRSLEAHVERGQEDLRPWVTSKRREPSI